MQRYNITDEAAQANLNTALVLADAGLAVFPVNPKTGNPRIEEWPDKATTYKAQIERWWHKWPDSVPGIVTGDKSGVSVLDLDRKNGKDGVAVLEAMGFDPLTLSPVIVETPTGGLHIYFRHPEGLRCDSSGKLGAGVDIKAHRGFVFAPGAVKATGAYRSIGALDLVDVLGLIGPSGLPEWPKALMPPQRAPERPSDTTSGTTPLDVLRDALMAIPLDVREEKFGTEAEWFKVARILHDETGGSDEGHALWHEWSEGWGGYDYDEAEAKWNRTSVYSGERATVRTIFTVAEKHGWHDLRAFDSLPTADPMDGFGRLMVRAGRPVSNLHNAICILGRDVESILPGLRHNLMNGRDEWTGGEVTDTDLALVRVALEQRGLETISKELVHEAVAAVARHRQFHPIRDYLHGLRHDGTARLDSWLIRHAGAEDSPYTRAVGRAFLISMVARVMQPGCKVDTTLALVGPQGIGKSTLCRVLAGDAYFSDSMPSITGRNSDRDTRAHLRGIWLAEIAEMAATRRSESEDLKSFMTASTDRIRLPYGRREIEIPRQCVFIGTTNDDQFLTDPTGNRRYWPVTCGEKIDTEGLALERDQLFAEALAAYRAGERWWFDPEFEAQHVLPVQDAARAPDPWEDEILNWIQTPVRDFDGEHPREEVTIQEILTDVLGLPVERQTMGAKKRAGHALRKIGWEKMMTGGRNVWRSRESLWWKM